MKRSMAVLAALAIGLTYSPPGVVALAEENEEKIIETGGIATESKETEEDTTEKENSFIDNLLGDFFSIKEEKEVLPDDSSKKMQEKEASGRETSGLKNLQIPQKFEVVIDPWEMDGKGQIYSEQYIISNTGDTPGILTLSNLVCRPREQSGVIVRTDKEGLHDSGDKSIYMEMLFRKEERIVFSKEGCQYQTELKPGEELPVCFVGEVNENAFGKWENDDIVVSLVYSWEMEEKQAVGDTEKEEPWIVESQEETVEKQQDDEEILKEKDQEGNLQADMSSENSEAASESDENEGEMQKPQSGTDESVPKEKTPDHIEAGAQQSPSPDLLTETLNEQEASETHEEDKMSAETQAVGGQEEPTLSESGLEITGREEEEIKSIELRESQKINVSIDSWAVDEKGKITSTKYMLKNVGDTAGMWSFTELVCTPKKGSGIKVCTDSKETHSEDAKAAYMELIVGNGKKITLSQRNSEYEVKLEPGQEISVCFVGELNRSLLEAREETDIEVTTVCSWNIEQTVKE